MKLTAELARELLYYDPATGRLVWRKRRVELFSDTPRRTAAHAAANWNARWAGKPAFTALNKGRHCGAILGRNYEAHRVIWLLMTGAWPAEIDHINGNPEDNRWCNLRDVDRADNARNLPLRGDNRSGYVGVHRHSQSGRWVAQIRAGGVCRHLGVFDRLEDAVAAREEASRTEGYHPNHGRLK